MLSRGLESFRESWDTFDLCTGLKCLLEGLNASQRVGIPLNTVEMHSTGLECLVEGWNAFQRVGMPLYRVGMLSRRL
jgi:hypothetical protein